MKYIKWAMPCLAAIAIFSVAPGFGQEKMGAVKPMPKAKMNMAAMHKDGHHAVMMAYHHSAVAFTRALLELSSDGTIEDIEIARSAFAEIKRSMDKMDEIHKMHMASMGKMDEGMSAEMKPMMEKMEAEKASVSEHMRSLETELSSTAPKAREIETHSAALLAKLEKMGMPPKKK